MWELRIHQPGSGQFLLEQTSHPAASCAELLQSADPTVISQMQMVTLETVLRRAAIQQELQDLALVSDYTRSAGDVVGRALARPGESAQHGA